MGRRRRTVNACVFEHISSARTQTMQEELAMAALSLKQILVVSVLALTLALGSGSANGAEKLGSYPVDAKKVSISGISSGAFMANQVHIAHSALIMGAGMIAGGLYACAVDGIEGDHLRVLDTLATGPCMSWPGGLQRFEVYKARVEEFAERGWIDPLNGLEGDRVYLFTGRSDKVVNPETVHRAAQLYLSLGVAAEDLKLVDVNRLPGKGAGHSWVTVDYGGPCDANTDPYIDACGYDQAEDILHHIYGALKPRPPSLSGEFVEFSQAEFAPHGKPVENGLNEVGYLYVPKACEPGGGNAKCALHVALHGCLQSAELLGGVFYKNVGLNEWADGNNIIVLYPQAHTVSSKDFTTKKQTDLFEINPAGCWNWFGYSYDDHYPLRDGGQVTAIYNMIQRVMGES
jgi:poly(3-hydroxybutyrate) depolymerase